MVHLIYEGTGFGGFKGKKSCNPRKKVVQRTIKKKNPAKRELKEETS